MTENTDSGDASQTSSQRRADRPDAAANDAVWNSVDWPYLTWQNADQLAELPDDQIIGDLFLGNSKHPRQDYVLEMQRRLKVATEENTAQLIRFRESAQAAADKSDRAAAKLETLTKWLIGLTFALMLLTLVAAILTGVVAAQG